MMSPSRDNLVVEVRFEIEKDGDGYPKSRDAELLLCKPLDPECTHCLVASVPFYLKDVAYGDTISTTENPSGRLQFRQIVERGGYSVYRVLLRDSTRKETVIKELLDRDVLLEHDGNLIAIAIPPTADGDAIVKYLMKGKRDGVWGAQDGYVFEGSKE
jgi:hypothetical protein